MEIITPTDEIGDCLRVAREGRGWSIEDVHFRTKLPRDVIRSLEANDFAAFAGPMYARSFLAQYSDYLHIDASKWLGAIEEGDFVPDEDVLPVIGKEHDVSKNESRREASGFSWMPMIGFVVITGALLWGAIALYRNYEAKMGSESISQPSESSQSEGETSQPSKGQFSADRLSVMTDDEQGAPPPRARIVREKEPFVSPRHDSPGFPN